MAHGVVASASLAVKRRHRRAKTARLAVPQWLLRRLRHAARERQGGRLVRGPRVEAEDRRQLQRAFATVQQERTRVLNRLQGLLAAHGLVLPPGGDFPQQLEPRRRWDGPPLPGGLRHRLDHEWAHVQAVAPRMAQ